MMQRKIFMAMAILALALGLSFVNVRVANSIEVTATGSVGATATVLSSYSLTVQAKNVTDNSNATGIAFGPISSGTVYAIPSAYVEISYSSNAPSWALEIYTNNTTWTGPGSDDRGGLIGQTNTNRRVPMLWQVHNNVQRSHPVLNQSEAVDLGHWTWVTDIGDPIAPTEARRKYREVLTGVSDYTWLHGYPGGEGSTSSVSPVVVYLGGRFDGVPTDNYSTTLIFDLHHR